MYYFTWNQFFFFFNFLRFYLLFSFQNGKTSLGDVIHGYITSEKFSPECLLDCLDLSSEHQALEIANRVEAASFIWRRKTTVNKPKSSWGIVREFMVDAEKRELLSERAETLLLCLKQRFPALTQTTLDMSKIQYNKVVKSKPYSACGC